MALSVDDVGAAVAPTLYADARWSTFVAIAQEQLTAAAWGNVYGQASAYLAAHLLQVAIDAENAGAGVAGSPLTGITTGALSESYGATVAASNNTDDALLATTSYGRQFLALRRTRAAGRARVVVPT